MVANARGSASSGRRVHLSTMMAGLALATLAGCNTPDPVSLRARPDLEAPARLPDARHGHRIEPLPDGYLCIGGFARGAGRDQDAVSFLPAGSKQWQGRAPLPNPQAFAASATIRGHVHAIGRTVERYDASKDRWQTIVGPGSLPQSHFGACAIDDRIFVLGGFPQVGTGFSIVDADQGTVQQAEPPPSFEHGDHFHFVHSLLGELHVIGGIDGETFTMHTHHWVRRDGEWHALPPCPEGLWAKFAAHAVHDGKLYLFGEFGGYCYDPAQQMWHERAAMPQMLAMPATVATASSLWVIGGMKVEKAEAGTANVLWRYDLAADRWHEEQGR